MSDELEYVTWSDEPGFSFHLHVPRLKEQLAKYGLALVPAADVQPISDETLRHLLECVLAWEPKARVIGDVTAHQLRAFCLELAKLRRE